jgi:hypothetical protein
MLPSINHEDTCLQNRGRAYEVPFRGFGIGDEAGAAKALLPARAIEGQVVAPEVPLLEA